MDPERNHGGKTSGSGEQSPAVAAVSAETPPIVAVSTDDDPDDPVVEATSSEGKKASRRTRPKAGSHPNNVRKLRQGAMMSKAELARRAGVSPLTIDRVEAGCPCRMDTKRKILEALGLQPSAAREVFPDLDQQA